MLRPPVAFSRWLRIGLAAYMSVAIAGLITILVSRNAGFGLPAWAISGLFVWHFLVLPVVGLLWWRRLTSIDASVAVRTDAIDLLRQVPMLRPLPVPVIVVPGKLVNVVVG